MRILVLSIFLITLMGMIFIPNAFGTTYIVKIPYGSSSGNNYDPNLIEIQKDDTVKWANLDRNTAHTVTSTATDGYAMQEANKGNHPNKGAYGYSGLFDSGEMRPNNESNGCYPNCKPSFSYTFAYGGTFTYECRIHSWMQGVVKVIELGQDAETKRHSDAGDMYIDKKQYEVTENKSAKIKIYGEVKNPKAGDRVDFTITKPDGSTSELKTYRTGDGYYQLILSVNYEDRGTYNVVSTFGLENIGTANFEVVKSKPVDIISPAYSQSDGSGNLIGSLRTLTIDTNLQSYEKGSAIHISGIVPCIARIMGNTYVYCDPNVPDRLPPASGLQLTLRITDPRNNIVTVSQLNPNVDGTYFASINAEGPMWKFGGDYSVMVNYGESSASTTFAFTIPNIPFTTSSKDSTFLKLESIDNTINIQGQNSEADVIITGQLLEGDRKTGIPDTKIKLVTDGFSLANPTLTTDSLGKFAVKVTIGKNFVGEQLSIQTVYDGSSNFKSSKSQTEYFDVRTSSQSQSTQSEDNSYAGIAGLLIVVVVIAGIVIGITRARKKRTITVSAGRGTAGTATILKAPKPRKTPRGGKAPLLMGKIRQAKRAVGRQSQKAKSKIDTMHYLRCKVCLSEELENEADGQQYCTKCEWRKK